MEILRAASAVALVPATAMAGEQTATFDDAVTDVASLTRATTEIGFPSQPIDNAESQTQ